MAPAQRLSRPQLEALLVESATRMAEGLLATVLEAEEARSVSRRLPLALGHDPDSLPIKFTPANKE